MSYSLSLHERVRTCDAVQHEVFVLGKFSADKVPFMSTITVSVDANVLVIKSTACRLSRDVQPVRIEDISAAMSAGESLCYVFQFSRNIKY